jgi:pre-mRNA-splicing factor CDC5/CEF1
MIKGGVWKNTEDEILKAAVMKYGKNQWARVASLLSRKSAKQCKARWYEWLDPSIKKTEWSREEEEKLLHLAKLMPSQWRTIAPIVGRTAAQCMEHYEYLLDSAQQKEGINVADDSRRLRPGEIDPNPENKPARPDPVDMDEDEKEMLSEARARLANTKGKKAKRKAREKQLEEARRMAALQKRRELKAAGISSRIHSKKRKFIDYAKEIPFLKETPAGFYDVSEERQLSSNPIDPKQAALQLDKVEGIRRDDQEKRHRKQDAQRQKSLMKSNLPQQIEALNKRNDPVSAIKRKPLNLPAPVVSNEELVVLAKLGMDSAYAAELALENSSEGGTQALISKYAGTPAPVVSTTRRSKDIHCAIMEEAANQAAVMQSSTPLLGGENVTLQTGTGYDGATPSRTPIFCSTALSKTPLNSNHTPLRDELGINPEQLYRTEKAIIGSTLKQSIENLPAPQNEYELNIPQMDEDTKDTLSYREEDAEDREARLKEEKEQEKLLERKRQTEAVQKGLPRPYDIDRSLLSKTLDEIATEMVTLVKSDAIQHPYECRGLLRNNKEKKTRDTNTSRSLLKFSDDQMLQARSIVQIEATLVSPTSSIHLEHHMNAYWTEMQSYPVKKTNDGTFMFADTATEKVTALKKEFDALKEVEEILSKRIGKLHDRLRIMSGGFHRRIDTSCGLLNSLNVQLRNACIERDCFTNLASLESHGLRSRLAKLANSVDDQQFIEVQLQKRFASLRSTT